MAQQEIKENTLFVVILMHHHGTDYSHTIGKITAQGFEEAGVKSRMWLARKMKEHGCKSYGDRCFSYIDTPNRSLKTLGLDIGAEEIEPKVSP